MKEDKKIDYDGLPYWIMEYCTKNQKSGKLTCALYTDDFQYSDWQKILPQEWIDDAIKNGDVNMALEKYFNVMGDLELLFSELCYFHIDNSGSFPEQILYIRLKTEDVIEMHYLVGQGSEFYITLTEEVNNLPFIIDWNDAVHGYHKKCKYDWFIWKPEGSSPEEIKIQCPDPKCKKEVTMLDIYARDFDCHGRLPEKQMPLNIFGDVSFPNADDVAENQDCDRKMFVVQRQSSSLRVANTFTLLRMPRAHDYVIKILMKPNYKFAPEIIKSGGLEGLLNFVKTYSLNDYKKIDNYFNKKGKDFDSFKTSYFKSIDETNFNDALIDEFDLLMDEDVIINDENFEKGEFRDDYSIEIFEKKFPIKIRPISKLKTITAQISYHRKPQVPTDENGKLLNKPVSSGYKLGQEKWFPAFEGIGEGIFVSSDENPIEYLGLDDISEKWYPFINKIDTSGRDEIKKPLFVWWHTLSHALINSLAISCGYNSTSLKERVYINNSEAGILIYNTSPGEDSGMGGLIDLVDSFGIVLENAINNLKFCSNDPLCFEEEIGDNKVNGAACHNCLLISETSCEHRNTLLDRHFFVD